MSAKSIFRSAIENSDGEVDSGELAGFVVTVLVLAAIPVIVGAALVAMWLNPQHPFDAAALGTGIREICVGFGAAMAGVGACRWGDGRRPSQGAPQ